jgi:MFS family permease
MSTQTIRKIFTREFLLASGAQFALAFVFFVLIPTLPIYLSKSGSNEVEIGVLIGVFAVSSLFLRPFVGRALLRIPEKNFLMVGGLLYALASAAYLFTPPFWPFFFVRVLQGIGYACSSTAILTLIANVSPEGHRGQSLGYFLLTNNMSSALAPTIGMFLINNFGFSTLFLVCSGLSIGALVVTSQLQRREITPRGFFRRGRFLYQQESSFHRRSLVSSFSLSWEPYMLFSLSMQSVMGWQTRGFSFLPLP